MQLNQSLTKRLRILKLMLLETLILEFNAKRGAETHLFALVEPTSMLRTSDWFQYFYRAEF